MRFYLLCNYVAKLVIDITTSFTERYCPTIGAQMFELLVSNDGVCNLSPALSKRLILRK